MNTIAGIPNASMHIIFDDRTGKNASTLAGTQFGLSGLNGRLRHHQIVRIQLGSNAV